MGKKVRGPAHSVRHPTPVDRLTPSNPSIYLTPVVRTTSDSIARRSLESRRKSLIIIRFLRSWPGVTPKVTPKSVGLL